MKGGRKGIGMDGRRGRGMGRGWENIHPHVRENRSLTEGDFFPPRRGEKNEKRLFSKGLINRKGGERQCNKTSMINQYNNRTRRTAPSSSSLPAASRERCWEDHNPGEDEVNP